MSRIYVDNLPETITSETLTSLFAGHGSVVSVSIVLRKSTGTPAGHAFVQMDTDASAKEAIHRLNGTQLGGKKLTVTKAGPTAGSAGFSGTVTTEERKNR